MRLWSGLTQPVLLRSPWPAFSTTSGLPIEIGWAFVNTGTGEVQSESDLVKPPLHWDMQPVGDPDAEKLRGISLEQLLAQGRPPFEVARRMNNSRFRKRHRSWTLPVTTLGCMVGEHYVIQPDGRVARCFKVYGSDAGVMGKLGRLEVMAGGAQKPPATPQEQADDDVTTNAVPFYLPGTDDMEPRPL